VFRRCRTPTCLWRWNRQCSEGVEQLPAYEDGTECSEGVEHLPAYEDGTECSETSAYKIQTPGNYPEENIQHIKINTTIFTD